MLKIKVCGICDPVNLKEVAEAAPDFMGFIFYKGSKRYAGEDTVKDLIALVPDGIIRTGVFVNDKPETILNYAGDLRLDAIQLHGSESPDCCEKIKAGNLIIIKAFGIGENFDFNRLIPYMDTCDYFLFDTKTQSYGGSGRKFNWTRLDEYKFYKKFIIFNPTPIFVFSFSSGFFFFYFIGVTKYKIFINLKFENIFLIFNNICRIVF